MDEHVPSPYSLPALGSCPNAIGQIGVVVYTAVVGLLFKANQGQAAKSSPNSISPGVVVISLVVSQLVGLPPLLMGLRLLRRYPLVHQFLTSRFPG
jgi:hypothetical protein